MCFPLLQFVDESQQFEKKVKSFGWRPIFEINAQEFSHPLYFEPHGRFHSFISENQIYRIFTNCLTVVN